MSDPRRKYLYWVSTSLLAIGMIGAGVQEVGQAPQILEAAHRLGYPDYVLTLLGLAKLVGAPLLLIQRFPHLKEFISHTAVGDTFFQVLPAIFCAALLGLSYYSYRSLGSLARRLDAA